MPVDTEALARFLIGAMLVHDLPDGRRAGRIVETEAYAPGDASSHAFRGPTRRNGSMFLEPGHAYVYIAYGCWPALNVSSEPAGIGGGVLIRALEPLDGLAAMRASRGTDKLIDLARGPGRLTAAMGVSRAQDGADLCGGGPLWLGAPSPDGATVGATTRIGISKEVDRPHRFFERGSAFVSGPRRSLAG